MKFTPPFVAANPACLPLHLLAALFLVAASTPAAASPVVDLFGPIAAPCQGTALCVTSGWSIGDEDGSPGGEIAIGAPWLDVDGSQWVPAAIELQFPSGAGIAGYLPEAYAGQTLGPLALSLVVDDPFGERLVGADLAFVLSCSPAAGAGGRVLCAEGNVGPTVLRSLAPDAIERLATPGAFRWTWTGLDELAAPLEERSLSLSASLNVTVTYAPVPEPTTATLAALGLLALGALRRPRSAAVERFPMRTRSSSRPTS